MVRQQLYKRQNEIGEYIINLKQSCLKETARSVVKETCKAQLGQVWQEFKNNHTKLTELGITEEPYFKNKYYEKVNSLVEEICAALETNEDAASQLETGKTESSGLKLQQIQPQENGESKNEKERIAGKRKERIRKLIRKLVGELLELEQLNIKVLLEEAKRSWETQMNQINDLLWELTINHEGSYEDITKEVDEVENLYKRSKTTLILRLDKCKEERCPIKLAEIKIPDFYGNVEEWPSFHDLYKKLVHDAESLSDVEKMFYLKAHIKGEASKVIKHLPADGSNYQPAWEILNQRFGNKRILFQTILDRLLDQPHVCSENAKQVKGLLDTTIECVQGLKAMKCNIEDAVMARVIIRKLDKEGLLLYEQHTKKSKEIQELKDVLEFLEERYQNLEAAGTKKYSSNYNHRQQQPMKSTTLYTDKSACLYCRKQGHLTEECRSLLRLTVAERVSWVKTKNICHRCLNHNQNARCDSTIKCGTCGFKHHSVLHLTKTSTTCVANGTRSVLLATAQVQVKNIHGEMVTLKALVDQGSQSTFLREEAAQILQIPREKANMELHGLGDNLVGVAKSKVKVRIHPRFPSNYSLDVEALILPALASVHLDSSLVHNQGVWKNFQLADPNYYKNERIDMVLGGDVYVDILKNGIHKKHGMLGQHTKLGLMLSGPLTIRVPVAKKGVNVTTEIERFWETEELDMDMVTNDDEKCLDNYAATTKRNEEGRFIVQIPFKEDKELGTSYKQAAARLISLEKKLIKDNAMKHEYSRIMEEYIALGNMKPVKQIHSGKYYLPHQAVVREDSLTTKVRVVFDGSASTNNGRSLNDIMHVGPRLQRDVFDILLNFRLKRFVISSDVEKMYRQIMVDEESQRYQHVLWRKDRNEEIKEYQLTTVTFGTASAPFLAVRTLMQIAKECADTKVKQIIEEDFYMDDLLTGADTIEECLQLRFKISRHLEGYGFHLRKWCSNNEHIVKSSKEDKENEIININETTNVKTLGLQWKPKEDEFRFKISEYPAESTTKRLALSYLAKIFDPLGLLTPVIITAKLFIQSLWLLEMQWDQKIDGDLEISWKEFVTRISSLQDVKIPRWLNSSSESKIKILGFADASEKAYAAVVYIKTDKGVSLMAAKSKVNPIKNKKTLPKLELCAAFLLARLLNRIISVVKAESEVYAWSDSTITLAWIENNKSKDKFIRSRVTGIKNLVSQAQWRYVKSKENPADLGSRGVSPDKLVDSKLWWEGPQWLLLPEAEWSLTPPELKTCASTASKEAPTLLNDLIERYSSYGRLLRVYSYILRFVEKLKGTRSFPSYLTREELLKAEKYIVKGHQKIEWPSEVQKLRDNRQMDHRHKLANLHPYLDEEGVLRVGGRLQYSDLQLDQKHPMIIRKSRLAYLIIRDTHYKTMHGGNRLVECTVRRKFWIINVKNCIKKVIRSCPVCIRYRQQNTQQLMGILPDYRVKVSFPFYHCGVDLRGLQFHHMSGHAALILVILIIIILAICFIKKFIQRQNVSPLNF
ncbi:uncharacterized protein LOC131998022 [Stomoxys calcitrans]|uniref:uncharacterized protein LOC131998022 n=1 Tax=Stomoxys calcitrans TaxID=35570 RepID=UPI0027E39D52|nr:uncharacterized protein LOC131998022 [Stomoxys calcitrans]